MGRASLAFAIMVWDSPAIQAEAPEVKLYLDYWQSLSDEAREEFWQESDALRQANVDSIPVI